MCINRLRFLTFTLLFSCFFGAIHANSLSQEGRILFLIQQGEHPQALKLYQTLYQEKEAHDYDLLHRLGIGLLDYGFRQSDPEIQLLTLFGANVAAHEDVYYILEESLKSRLPPIQLVALATLSQIQQDRADQALLRSLGTYNLQTRFEAVHYLCKKKHPQAADQAESLMFKSPKALRPLFPPLFARLGDAKSIRILKKLINDPSEDVRKAVILCVAKAGRDDFLPQIRQQALHYQFAQQEACAYALGILKDDYSIDKLKKLASSQYPSVALAANWSLYQLGQDESVEAIEKLAFQNDLFAMAALGSLNGRATALIELAQHSNLQVKVNAILALFEQSHAGIQKQAEEIILRDKRDLGFIQLKSPGGCFQAWKVVTGASELLNEDLEIYKDHLELKESILMKTRELNAVDFIDLATKIFNSQQNELIPMTIELLEEMNTEESIRCLKIHQQKLGAPLIRNYCNLALYRLGESGPYGDQLRQWVRNQSQSDLIQFRDFNPSELNQSSYTLTPIETSRLLIESFEAFAAHQDKLGIELLIEVIATGHQKNKYALAGILLRATQ